MALPHLSINMAMTLDGKVVLPDGRWHGMSSSEDHRRMRVIRKKAKALIMGVNSIENDDPSPSITDGEGPVPVIIARSKLPDPSRKVFKYKNAILYTRKETVEDNYEIYNSICTLRIRDEINLTPRGVLLDLQEQSGMDQVLLEGGPRLNYSFFRDDLVSEMYLTVVPFIIGNKNLSSIVDGNEAFFEFEKPRWALISAETVGDEVFLRYSRRNGI